jgi:hypothetical protein
MDTFSRFMVMLAVCFASLTACAYEIPIHAHVLKVSDVPVAGSGILKIWMSLDVVEDRTSTRQELLMIYLSEQQAFPKAGDDCLFNVHQEWVGGFVGRGSEPNHDATVVDDFRCGGDVPKAFRDAPVTWPGISH